MSSNGSRSIKPHTVWSELERRIAFSAATFASLSLHGTLSIAGTGKADIIVAQFNGATVQAKLNGKAISFDKEFVKRIWVDGFGGNDGITNGTSLPSTLLGAGGNDTIYGGSGVDSIDGGVGRDLLFGEAGADFIQSSGDGAILHGGDGNDTLFTQADDTEMYGESGNDFLDAYGTGTDTLDGGTGNDNLVSFDSGCKMFGGSGDDVLNTHTVAVGTPWTVGQAPTTR